MPRKIRFFLCGEYGTRTGRAHYHAVLFGAEMTDSDAIESSWGHGYVQVSPLTLKRARYAARYVTKKLIGHSSYADGRLPEFQTSSLRPGLGAHRARMIGRSLMRENGTPMVPSMVSIHGKSMPLDTYLRGKIAEEIGGESKLQKRLRRLQRSNHGKKAEILPLDEAETQNETLKRKQDKGEKTRPRI